MNKKVMGVYDGMNLSAEEVSELYGYSIDTVKNHFKRTARAIKNKHGVDLVKCESITGIYYRVVLPRALTMYEEDYDELYIPLESIKMDDLACFVLIGVAAAPQGIFRGSYKDFLDYIGLAHTKRNIELLKQVLKNFFEVEDAPVKYQVDDDFIIIYIARMFEKKQILTIDMLRECQRIAKKHKKKAMKVVQLLKVWQAYRINEQKGVNPLTDRNLQEYIDLSEKQIRDAKKLLESEGVLKTNRVGRYDRRYGTAFDLNGFLDNKEIVVED